MVPKKETESVHIEVIFKVGSRYETPDIAGIAHFLEHTVTDGTKKRKAAIDIQKEIDQVGGFSNAYTSREITGYFVRVPAEKAKLGIDILSDMLYHPKLTSKDINKEKGVIIEEIRMYEDTPMMKIGDVFEELIYSGTTLGMDISGTEKSVLGMKREDFTNYRDNFYNSENIIVTVAGGVKKEEISKLATKYFSKLSTKQTFIKSDGIKNHQLTPKVKLHGKKKEQTHIILGFLADGKEYKGKYAQTILSAVLGGGMSSRMFIEVRERRGLAYAVRTSMDRYSDIGYLGTYAGLDVSKAVEAVKVMLDEHNKITNSQSPVTRKELTKAKEFLKGHLALALEDTSDVNSFFGDQELFSKKVLTPDEVFTEIDSVTLDEVRFEAKRLFVPERLNLSIIGPYENSEEFDKIIK